MATRDHIAYVVQPVSRTGVRRRLALAYRLVRFPAIGFTILVVVLGAASASPLLGGAQLFGLVVVSAAFHVFAYVLNDLIDLPLDRSEPLRRDYPLVNGTILTGTAKFIAAVQVPVAFAATLILGGGAAAIGALSAAFVLMAAYDVWGKRMPFPPLADALQGVAWGALAMCGTYLAGSGTTPLTWALVTFVFVYILLINGFHGPLRDLENDFSSGARTTAIYLGARPTSGGAIVVPSVVHVYALILQLALTVIVLLPPILGWLDERVASLTLTFAGSLLLSAACFAVLVRAGRSREDRRSMYLAGALHLVLSLGLVVVLFLLYVGAGARLVLLAAYVLPVFAMWMYNRRAWAEPSTFSRYDST